MTGKGLGRDLWGRVGGIAWGGGGSGLGSSTNMRFGYVLVFVEFSAEAVHNGYSVVLMSFS